MFVVYDILQQNLPVIDLTIVSILNLQSIKLAYANIIITSLRQAVNTFLNNYNKTYFR